MREYLYRAQQRVQGTKLNPEAIPVFRDALTEFELDQKRLVYSEELEIIRSISTKILNLLQGVPIVIVVSDERGYLLELSGDPSIRNVVSNFGIRPGVRFTEEECGINVVNLALIEHEPIKLVGTDHYHVFLHGVACYGVVIHDMESGEPIGSLSMMTLVEHAHDYFLPMIITAIDSIERDILLIRKNKTLDVLNHMILEATSNAVIIVDHSGMVKECNESFLKYLGFQQGELIGSCVRYIPFIGSYMDDSIKDQRKYTGIELYVHNPREDVTRICSFDSFPVFDKGKNPLGALGQLRDITERINTEKSLIQAERLSVAGQLGAAFAHEIRNPLMVVKGFLQLMAEENATNVTHLNIILSQFGSIEKIINEFLDVTKPHPSSYRQCDIHTLLQSTLSVVYPMTNMKGIAVSINLTKDRLCVLGDEYKLKQIFLNLMNNAIESMDHGGTITVSAHLSECGEEVCIEIRDEGHGIDPNVLPKLGMPFYTTKDKGTGLGLTVSSVLIEQHGGTIQFQKTSQSGTSVFVTFPASWDPPITPSISN